MTENKPSSVGEVDLETEERDDAIIGTALRWSLLLFAVVGVIGGIVAFVLTRPEPPPPEKKTELATVEVREAPKLEIPQVPFTNITEEAGIHFKHENGAGGKKLLPETMGGGGAFFDFDNDGDQDLYVANDYARNNLYRNNDGKFEDVAEDLGVGDQAFGMSVSWGDYDRNGNMDLYIANMFSSAGGRVTTQLDRQPEEAVSRLRHFSRGNTLLKNNGDDSFSDVSEAAGVTVGRWAWGSNFVDINNDGWEDVVVANGFLTTDDTGDL